VEALAPPACAEVFQAVAVEVPVALALGFLGLDAVTRPLSSKLE
jgi:hypothetical protein